MKKLIGKLSLIIIVISFFQCSKKESESLPFYNKADFTPEWISEDSSIYPNIHTIAKFSFTNQNGNTITNKSVEGKVYVANFFFTICPGVCPKMMGNMDLLQDEFRNDKDFAILSHSVTPWIDTIQTLKEYADRNNITAQNWQLLTGTKKQIYELARESYFADEGFGKNVTLEDDFLHTENIILIDQKGRIRGVYSGTSKLEVKQLIKDIYKLKK